MDLAFLHGSLEERRLLIEQSAQLRGISPVIMEKDFWVCWVLLLLFDSTLKEDIVFKGGTSLSKAFGVIERFSEDIDLSLSPKYLGLRDLGTAGSLSRSQADKWMKEAESACAAAVKDRVGPELESKVSAVLGHGRAPWFEHETDTTTHSPILLFHYPTTQTPGFEYLKRSVKLEFGSLTDQQPTGRHPIRPWLAEEHPDAFRDWTCRVVALELDRTYWEKATILHSEHYRPEERDMPLRVSRHYADMVALAESPVASAAIHRHDIRDRVVQWKSRFFGSQWARYDLAVPGTFKIVPPEARMGNLRRDYAAMSDMFLGQPRNFDHLIATLKALESRINSTRGEEA